MKAVRRKLGGMADERIGGDAVKATGSITRMLLRKSEVRYLIDVFQIAIEGKA